VSNRILFPVNHKPFPPPTTSTMLRFLNNPPPGQSPITPSVQVSSDVSHSRVPLRTFCSSAGTASREPFKNKALHRPLQNRAQRSTHRDSVHYTTERKPDWKLLATTLTFLGSSSFNTAGTSWIVRFSPRTIIYQHDNHGNFEISLRVTLI
jgi:hypothetical protein